MTLIYKLLNLMTVMLIVSSTALSATKDFKVAFGSSIMAIAEHASAAYESRTGEKVNALQENGMSADSVLILVSRGIAELGVSGNSWENILELAKTKKLEIINLEQIKHKVIGIDHIKIVTYSGGPKKLSKAQLKMVFTGQALNWRDVGGEDVPIQIVLAARLPATEQTFAKAALDGEDIYRKGAKTFQTMKEMSVFILARKGAVGITSSGNEMPELNNPDHPPIEKVITAMTLGEPSDRATKLMDEYSRVVAQLGSR